MADYNLASWFWNACKTYPERLALAGKEQLTYAQALERVQRLASWLNSIKGVERVAILASRSHEACLAVLAAAWNATTYIPLGLSWPAQRLSEVVEQTQPQALLIDIGGENCLTEELRRKFSGRLLRIDQIDLVNNNDRVAEARSLSPKLAAPDSLAYVLFTSGTTGRPKGVMVTVAAVTALIEYLRSNILAPGEYRLANNFDLSFDGSVLDMFYCWAMAATLYPVPASEAMAPYAFLKRYAIQFCLLTPSHLHFMLALKPAAASLPHLRYSLWGGEALSIRAAQRWQEIAPGCQQYNVYGPTEATVICLWWKFEADTATEIAPLGQPFSGMQAQVVDADLQPVLTGVQGELLLRGDQLSLGYWQDPALTRARFPVLEGQPSYLTGDRVYRDKSGVLHFLGRVDRQVKLRGYRIELDGVETVLCRLTGGAACSCLLWTCSKSGLQQLVAFVAGEMDRSLLERQMRAVLPAYSVPSRIYFLEKLPCTANGKLDSRALIYLLDGYE